MPLASEGSREEMKTRPICDRAGSIER